MDERIGFIDEIGQDSEGNYIYRFDFTPDIDTIWGEYFNVAPAGIIPDLQPDMNSVSVSARVFFPVRMGTAKRNYCFSMQDCIDGIIPLIFSELNEDTVELNGKPFRIMFGETMDEVREKLSAIGIAMHDIEEVEHGDSSAIDKLLDSMEDNDDNFED